MCTVHVYIRISEVTIYSLICIKTAMYPVCIYLYKIISIVTWKKDTCQKRKKSTENTMILPTIAVMSESKENMQNKEITFGKYQEDTSLIH